MMAKPEIIAVREHHAPVGALRPQAENGLLAIGHVREHHAPVGALRLSVPLGWSVFL